jgi:hypothetical protein
VFTQLKKEKFQIPPSIFQGQRQGQVLDRRETAPLTFPERRIPLVPRAFGLSALF